MPVCKTQKTTRRIQHIEIPPSACWRQADAHHHPPVTELSDPKIMLVILRPKHNIVWAWINRHGKPANRAPNRMPWTPAIAAAKSGSQSISDEPAASTALPPRHTDVDKVLF
jgi:hypothetical protein